MGLGEGAMQHIISILERRANSFLIEGAARVARADDDPGVQAGRVCFLDRVRIGKARRCTEVGAIVGIQGENPASLMRLPGEVECGVRYCMSDGQMERI